MSLQRADNGAARQPIETLKRIANLVIDQDAPLRGCDGQAWRPSVDVDELLDELDAGGW